MSQAENYTELFDGGHKEQAEKLAENMSIRKEQDWNSGSTVYLFDDGSAVYAEGGEFRLATEQEIESCK